MKNLTFCAFIAILILLLFSVYGCGGTRQTNTEKQSNIEIKNEYQEGAKIVLGNTFTYTPFDALKPMKIEGKVYENAIVSNDKSVVIEKWKNRNINKTITIEKTKNVHREDNTWLHLGIVLIIVFGILAWLKIPSFKTGI